MAGWTIATRRTGVSVVSICVTLLAAASASGLTPAAVTLSATPNPAAYGSPVTLAVSISPTSASGKVTFYDGVTVLGIATLSSGAATLTVRSLESGPHSLRAYYAGGGSYTSATSVAVQETIRSIAQAGFHAGYSVGAGTNPEAIAIADFNQDGRMDMAVANYADGDVSVLLGNGDGTFRSAVNYTAGANPSAVVAGDFNGDGKPDLAVANEGANSISVLLGNGDGTFQAAVNYAAASTPCSMAAGDFNGDGVVDLAVSNCGAASIGVYLGHGDGTFAAAVSYAAGNVPASIAIGDFNGDGNTDLATANAADGTVAVLEGRGDGTFESATTYATANYALAIAAADLNGDGKPDIVASGESNAAVLLNNGSGGFEAVVSYMAGDEPYSVVVGDFNGDGIPDLMFADTAGNAVTMLAGNGNGTFQTNAAAWVAGNAPSFVAAADFNGDGIPDLAVADDGGGVTILLGSAPAALTMNCLLPGAPPLLDESGWSAPCSLINGTPPYSWAVTSGSMPPGIFLSATSGATVSVKGTPVVAGGYSFVVTATDSSSPAQTAAQTFSGTISILSTPAITSLNPATVTAGASAFTLTVNGTDFLTGAAVNWSGSALATTFVSAMQVTASVPSSLISSATSASITVTNPDGGISGSTAFTVTAASSGGGTSGGGSSGGGSSGSGGAPSGGGSSGGGGGGAGGASASSISLSASSLAFSYAIGGAVPAAQNVALFTGYSSGTYSTTVQAGSGASWLHVSPESGATPGVISVSLDSTAIGALSAQTYTGLIYVLGASGAVKLPVTLTVTAATSPSVSIAPANVLMAGTTPGAAQSGQITVLNTGGGAASYSASIASSNAGWLKIAGGATGSATNAVPGAVLFTADPAISGAGTFSASIQVTCVGKTIDVPVTFAVSAGSSTMTISQSAIALSGSGRQSAAVVTSSATPIEWTAATSAAWLQVSPASGQTSAANPASVIISANTTGLQPGTYYGAVNFTSSAAINSPQSVTVILNTPGAIASTAAQSTAITLSGSIPQQVTIPDTAGTPKGFAAIAAANDGGNWLSITPATGVPKNGAAVVTVSANPGAAGSGVHYGLIAVGFDDGSVQTAPVTLIAGGSSCTPSRLLMSASGLGGGQAQAGTPVAIAVEVTDDCGNPATPANTAVEAAFTDGDPAVSLVYAGTNAGGALWQGTWVPAAAASAMQMQITAAQGSLTPAFVSMAWSVASASSGGPGTPAAILNAASSTGAQAVAPGSYVAIYGSQLASAGYGLATTTPFSATLDGTEVFIGGQPLPLFYASPTQINALVPQSLAANTIAQLVIQHGATISAPTPVVVTQYQPGLYSQNQAGTGQGSIEISGTALLAAPASANSRPAQRGVDYIAIYCTGLGPVKGQDGEAPPADGYPANYPPLYQTVAPVSVSIGGVNATVVFSGLTPTLVGLYQVDAQVPVSAPAGDAVPVVVNVTDPVSGAIAQSNMVTIAVQ